MKFGKHPASAAYWEAPAVYAPAIPFIGLAVALIGTGVSVYSGIQQGKAAEQQSKYQQQVATNNATLAERAAKDAEERGSIAAQQQQQQTDQLIGRQRASLAGNGVEVDTGSALDITTDTAGIGAFDKLTLQANTAKEAAMYRAQGANFTGQANLYSTTAANQASATPWLAGGQALSGLSSVADKWYDLDQQGAFDSGSTSSGYVGGAKD